MFRVVTCIVAIFLLTNGLYSQVSTIAIDERGIEINGQLIVHKENNSVFFSEFIPSNVEDLLRRNGLSYSKKRKKKFLEYRLNNSSAIFYYDLERNIFVMGQLIFEEKNNPIVFSVSGITIDKNSTYEDVCGNKECLYCEDIITQTKTIYQGGCHMYLGNFAIAVYFDLDTHKKIRFLDFYFF